MVNKKISKINWKWLILFLLLGFIGWQLYKQKPSPPPPRIPLYRNGYRMIEVPGEHFESGDRLRIDIKEGEGRVFWAGVDEYTVGQEVFPATWTVELSWPLQLWVKGSAPVTIGYVPRKNVGTPIKLHTL